MKLSEKIKERRRFKLFLLITTFLSLFFISTYITLSPHNFETLRKGWESVPGQWKNEFKNVWSLPYGQGTVKWFLGDSIPNKPESLEKWATKAKDGNWYPPTFIGYQNNTAPRAKAGFIVLVRNRELEQMRSAMYDVESRFNKKYGYPWIFLNDQPFTQQFKDGVRKMTRSEIRFGQVPKEHWSYPDWINQTKAAETRIRMANERVINGGSESYRHMCRFNSGFFFRHPLTHDLDYYWRVEPGTKITCDVDYDPFLFMQMNNKTYGFTIALHEYKNSVATLYSTTQNFVRQHPEYINKNAAMNFIVGTDRQFANSSTNILEKDWNMCHFWSNFEIADLRLWRSKEYLEYFDYLDKAGGFFYERWGDAPIHTLAAILFQDQSKLHHFDDIGYHHHPRGRCPTSPEYHNNGRCDCDPTRSYDIATDSCLKYWWAGSTEKHANFAVPRTLLE